MTLIDNDDNDDDDDDDVSAVQSSLPKIIGLHCKPYSYSNINDFYTTA